jgi:hypothetical protein
MGDGVLPGEQKTLITLWPVQIELGCANVNRNQVYAQNDECGPGSIQAHAILIGNEH